MNSPAQRWQTSSIQLYLRVRHPSMDSSEISSALDLTPDHAVNAGAATSATGVRKLHSESYWLASLPTLSISELIGQTRQTTHGAPPRVHANFSRPSEAVSVAALQILLWLRKFEACRAFIDRVNAELGTVTLVVQRPDRDVPLNLSPTVCGRLAELGVVLEID